MPFPLSLPAERLLLLLLAMVLLLLLGFCCYMLLLLLLNVATLPVSVLLSSFSESHTASNELQFKMWWNKFL